MGMCEAWLMLWMFFNHVRVQKELLFSAFPLPLHLNFLSLTLQYICTYVIYICKTYVYLDDFDGSLWRCSSPCQQEIDRWCSQTQCLFPQVTAVEAGNDTPIYGCSCTRHCFSHIKVRNPKRTWHSTPGVRWPFVVEEMKSRHIKTLGVEVGQFLAKAAMCASAILGGIAWPMPLAWAIFFGLALANGVWIIPRCNSSSVFSSKKVRGGLQALDKTSRTLR